MAETVMTVAEAEAMLKDAVAGKRPADEVKRLQRQLREAEKHEVDADRDAAELRRLGGEVERDRQRDERLMLRKKADLAETEMRHSPRAPTFVASYGGLTVTVRPSRLTDSASRLAALNAAHRVMWYVYQAHEQAIGHGRATAAGQSPQPVRTPKQLAAFIASCEESIRQSVARGALVISVGETD